MGGDMVKRPVKDLRGEVRFWPGRPGPNFRPMAVITTMAMDELFLTLLSNKPQG